MGNKAVVERTTEIGDFSVSAAECNTFSGANSFTQDAYTDKPSGCLKDSSDAYLYNIVETAVECSDDLTCVGHTADGATVECTTCPEGTWKSDNDVCHRWSYLHNQCSAGTAFVAGSTTSDSFCELKSYDYIKDEPSDSTLDLSNDSTTCGAQYALVTQVGTIVCRECDAAEFKRVYLGGMYTSNNAFKRGSCCKNRHHHVCKQMLNEFELKCAFCNV